MLALLGATRGVRLEPKPGRGQSRDGVESEPLLLGPDGQPRLARAVACALEVSNLIRHGVVRYVPPGGKSCM